MSVAWKILTDGVMPDGILNPNCSEVVWRLEVRRNTREEILKALEPKDEDEEDGNIYTDDSYPNCCLDDMLEQLEGAINVDEA